MQNTITVWKNGWVKGYVQEPTPIDFQFSDGSVGIKMLFIARDENMSVISYHETHMSAVSAILR